MGEKSKDFLRQLDELILLFEKLRVKATNEGVILKDDPMYKNFELLSGNYKLIKNSVPPELIEEMGEPIKEMITQMVNQLKEELGVDDLNEGSSAAFTDELEGIDKLLKDNSLSEDEMNNLLDKRADLKKD